MPFLGIDIGTSAVKALLVDEQQFVVAQSEVPLATDRPRPGWSEQHPDLWWTATLRALAELRRAAPPAYAAAHALGLSGQMHGAVLLGADDRPLCPAILWNDGRAAPQAVRLNRELSDLGLIAGVPAMAGFTAPKILWLRDHRPDIHGQIAKLLLPKDWVRLRLTGECATDMCDAAGSLLLDEAARAWWRPVVDAVELRPSALPRLVEGSEPAGSVRPEAAAELGLSGGIVVAGGAGDVAAGAVGIGAVEQGDAFVSLGTSGQLFMTGSAYRPHPEALIHAFAHALPGRWFQMAALLNGASTLAWAASLFRETDFAALLARVEARGRPISPVLFLPYLAGERTPHDDPNARGVFFGMDGSTTAEDLVQAVLEGVALALMDADAALAGAGIRHDGLAAIGGGSRSRLWVEIIASALDVPLTLYRGGAKGPAFGAARLARIALTGEPVAAVCTRPDVEEIVRPDPARRAALAAAYPLFRDLYGALRPHFAARARPQD